ncbi:MAG: M48 family metallopeptidase [Succinivibrionaceae bacterium]|nr:M48 family metallopeptidase [Succinivibrionaceae bacterium]
MSNIKNALVTIFLLALGLVELTACSTTVNPAYGESRSQLLLIPEETINEAQAEAYEEDKNEAGDNLNSDTKFTKRVKSISEKLINVATQIRPESKNWNWEVNTITDDTVNAYCRSGGKIIVYTGLNDALNLNDDELAFVIGHEIAHALKEHGRESASQEIVNDGLVSTVSLLGDEDYASIASTITTVGILLPYSREMELEADNLGLEIIHKAGFDPKAALSVTKKLKEFGDENDTENDDDSGVNSLVNSMLSTHPDSADRLKALNDTITKHNLVKTSTSTTQKTKSTNLVFIVP